MITLGSNYTLYVIRLNTSDQQLVAITDHSNTESR